jgi:hypothetical protein
MIPKFTIWKRSFELGQRVLMLFCVGDGSREVTEMN